MDPSFRHRPVREALVRVMRERDHLGAQLAAWVGDEPQHADVELAWLGRQLADLAGACVDAMRTVEEAMRAAERELERRRVAALREYEALLPEIREDDGEAAA